MRSHAQRESLAQKYAAPTNQRLCALKSDGLLVFFVNYGNIKKL